MTLPRRGRVARGCAPETSTPSSTRTLVRSSGLLWCRRALRDVVLPVVPGPARARPPPHVARLTAAVVPRGLVLRVRGERLRHGRLLGGGCGGVDARQRVSHDVAANRVSPHVVHCRDGRQQRLQPISSLAKGG